MTEGRRPIRKTPPGRKDKGALQAGGHTAAAINNVTAAINMQDSRIARMQRELKLRDTELSRQLAQLYQAQTDLQRQLADIQVKAADDRKILYEIYGALAQFTEIQRHSTSQMQALSTLIAPHLRKVS